MDDIHTPPHHWPQGIGSVVVSNQKPAEKKVRPQKGLNCRRCNSSNTKFCYYNNYSLSQPRYFCKTCRRYWTEGGTLRNVPVGGGSRKNKLRPNYSSPKKSPPRHQNPNLNLGFMPTVQIQNSNNISSLQQGPPPGVGSDGGYLCGGEMMMKTMSLMGFSIEQNGYRLLGDQDHHEFLGTASPWEEMKGGGAGSSSVSVFGRESGEGGEEMMRNGGGGGYWMSGMLGGGTPSF